MEPICGAGFWSMSRVLACKMPGEDTSLLPVSETCLKLLTILCDYWLVKTEQRTCRVERGAVQRSHVEPSDYQYQDEDIADD